MRSRLLRELFVCGGRWGVKGLNWSRLASPQAPKRHSWCQIATASTCNSAAVYLVRTGEDFKQRSPDGGAREEQRNLLRIKSDGLLLPSNRARRHRGSSSACIIQSPGVKKLHLNRTFFSRGATPLPQMPQILCRFFRKPAVSPRRAVDTSHTSTGIGLKLVTTLRLFQPKPRVFRCEAAPRRTVGGDGGCLQPLPATSLGR